MKLLFKKTLPLLLALQLGFGLVAPKSDALIIGLTTGTGGVFYIGLGMFAFGSRIATETDLNYVRNWASVAALVGLILDDEAPASHEIDFEKVTPESLALAYDDKTAETIWTELKTLDRELDTKEFKFEFPKAIQDFVAKRSACNLACRKEIKKSEKALVNSVSTTFAGALNAASHPKFEVSPTTTKYLIEQISGYTFLSTEKELTNVGSNR